MRRFLVAANVSDYFIYDTGCSAVIEPGCLRIFQWKIRPVHHSYRY
jgi:hypothetical protein